MGKGRLVVMPGEASGWSLVGDLDRAGDPGGGHGDSLSPGKEQEALSVWVKGGGGGNGG